MTWSSNNPGVSAADWDWSEFGVSRTGGPHDRESAEERQAKEIDAAYKRGLSDGQARSSAAARAELASALSAALNALEQVRANRDVWKAQLQDDLVALSAAIARVVVDGVMDEDPALFVALAKKAVATLPADEAVRIRIHPEDLEGLTETGSVEDVVGGRTVRWIPDADVVMGGCIVEGPDKIVDGRLDEVLIRIVQRLRDA
jgi:flagellar assembly protein FliH